MSDQLVLAHLVRHLPVPALIADAGDDTSRRFLEFFTAKTRNRNTRAAYARAVAQFCAWCEGHGIRFDQLQPMIVAAYIDRIPWPHRP
jgi:integrase/recombinase XerD